MRNLFAVGISHHTASVDVREKMWLSDQETRELLPRIREQFFTECVIVSTCNRTELYGTFAPGRATDAPTVAQFLIDAKDASGTVDTHHFRNLSAADAVEQLFKVASGADSLVIGDIQIMNQLKEAFGLAREMSAAGPMMNRLMQAALHVGKRVRTETHISEGAVSVSYAAVELASKIFADFSRKSVLLLGAGETGELTLKHLAAKGIGRVKIANRTRERAEALANAFGGTVVDYTDFLDALPAADVVIASVSAPTHILEPEALQKVIRLRSHTPLVIIDIGVPRNVNPLAKRIDNVFLYDIDSLTMVVDRNLERRKSEMPKVHQIIQEEMLDFAEWYNAHQVGPAIQDLRDSFETIRREEVERNINRFAADDRELVEVVTKRIINKLLHQPMNMLKQGKAGENGDAETLLRIQTIRELFGIGKPSKEQDDG